MKRKGFITHADEVASGLLERGQQGGLGIPGTEFALFHLKHAFIKEPIFHMYDLDPCLRGQKAWTAGGDRCHACS
ncbi:hypothetical protein ACEQPO_03130 [Bacillus sp. SL00103]